VVIEAADSCSGHFLGNQQMFQDPELCCLLLSLKFPLQAPLTAVLANAGSGKLVRHHLAF